MELGGAPRTGPIHRMSGIGSRFYAFRVAKESRSCVRRIRDVFDFAFALSFTVPNCAKVRELSVLSPYFSKTLNASLLRMVQLSDSAS